MGDSTTASQHYQMRGNGNNSSVAARQANVASSNCSSINSQPPTPTQMRSDSPQQLVNVVESGGDRSASDTAAVVAAAYRATTHLPSNMYLGQQQQQHASVQVSSANAVISNATPMQQHSPPLHRSHPYHRPGNSEGVSHNLLRSSTELTLNEYNRSSDSGMEDMLRHCPLKIRTTESLSSGVGIGNYMIGGGSGLVGGSIHDAEGYHRMTLKQEPETGY